MKPTFGLTGLIFMLGAYGSRSCRAHERSSPGMSMNRRRLCALYACGRALRLRLR
jgi:hypothetical protein